jgi:uncharacterized protein YjiS (DUF1127 family)
LILACAFGIAALQQIILQRTMARLYVVRDCGPHRKKEYHTMSLNIVGFLQNWSRYGAAVRELSNLSDRELADIGITRSDIPRIAWEHAHR